MKSNSVFLIFGATVIIAGILLARLFANAPAKMADEVEKKTAAALATTPVPGATPAATPAPSPSPSPSPSPTTAKPAAPSTTQIAPAPRVDPQVEGEFLAASTSALQSIPSQDSLRQLKTSKVHFTPQQVIAAADQIGRVTEMLEAHPELAPRGLQFFKECAEKESSAESIRATCLSDFTNWRNRTGSNATPPKVPERIALLAQKLSS